MPNVARGFGLNGKSFYTNISKPQSVWLTYTVTPTNGVGVTSVKSNGYVNYVFMNTSTTPAATNGFTNPDPGNGYASISFFNNFNAFLGMRWSVVAPPTSTGTTSTTAQSPFVITALGTTTLAQWQAVGLPKGLTPTVGQAFIATATQAIGGTGTVGVPGVTNVGGVSIIGDPGVQLSTANIATNCGAQILLLFQDFAGSAVAPTAGSVVRLEFCYDGSDVTIDGL